MSRYLIAAGVLVAATNGSATAWADPGGSNFHGPHMSFLPELPELALKHWVIYFFRLRASTNPTAPIPINASVPGSGTAAILPPVSPGGLFLQGGKSGFW